VDAVHGSISQIDDAYTVDENLETVITSTLHLVIKWSGRLEDYTQDVSVKATIGMFPVIAINIDGELTSHKFHLSISSLHPTAF
jgi:hypothetical protein